MPEEAPLYAEARPRVLAAKEQVLELTRNDSNVLGAGFGRRIVAGKFVEEPACVVYVAKKMPAAAIPRSALIPETVLVRGERVRVDVLETGPFYAHLYVSKERPAPGGVSIGQSGVHAAGTLGCLVHDNVTGDKVILSNNHVLANENAANAGAGVVQPSEYDGGVTKDALIGYLRRFIRINFGGDNSVDCAIAGLYDQGYATEDIKGQMVAPTSGQAAVGLLFAGSCQRTLCCHMDLVCSKLNVEMIGGSSARSNPVIGGAVQKTGRTTQYTTGRIAETDITVSVDYDTHGSAQFAPVISTTTMSAPGDSGSVVCYGGSGQTEIPNCPDGISLPCAVTLEAARLTGLPLEQDLPEIREARDRYLAQTRIGRWAIAVFAKNEHALLDRAQLEQSTPDERELARALYERYAGEAKLALADPDRDDIRIEEQHFHDARVVLETVRNHLTDEEYAAAEELFALARPALGKNPRGVLEMLNDEALFARVREIAARLRTINTDGVPIE